MTDTRSLDSFDLTTEQGVLRGRNHVLRKARADRDLEAVDRILTSIIEVRPDRLLEQVERIHNAVAKGDHARAEAYLDKLNARYPDIALHLDPSEAMILLRAVSRLGHDADALMLAEQLRTLDGDAQLGSILLQVFEKAGRVDRLLELADDVFAKSADRPDVRARLISYLVDAGYTSKVFALFGGSLDLTQENVEVVLQVARAQMRARPTDPAGVQLLEDVFAFIPDNDEVRLTLSQAYLQFGRAKDALEILELEPGAPVTGKDGWRQHVADTLLANDRFAEAGMIYRELSRENPLHDGWRRSGIGALIQAGEHAKAAALYEEDRMRRRLSASDSFGNRLRALNGSLEKAPIPPVRFDWAYRKLQQLNAAPSDRAAWEAASRRVYLADILTIDWLETRPDDVDQLIERIRDPDASLQPLQECLEAGQGAFIAALHMGSMFSGPALMNAQGINFKWLASTPAISAMPGHDKLISTTSQSAVSVARQVFKAIRSGSAVTIAIDGGAPSVSRPVPFLGDDVLVTDMVPRTVFQTGVRSFYPKVIWVGEEISVELIELIPPAPDDTLESFTSVWFRDFFECVGEMLVEAPDNMRLAGGFWTRLAT